MITGVEMKARLEEEYPIGVEEIAGVTGHLYRVMGGEEEWRLVPVDARPSRLIFAYTVVNHLRERGFSQVLRLMLTRSGEPGFEYADRYWMLMSWVDGQPLELTRLDDVERVSRELARMHRYMAGVYPAAGVRQGCEWKEWPETIAQGRRLMEVYVNRVVKRGIASEFDRMLVRMKDSLLERTDRAVGLAQSVSSRQMMASEREERAVALRQIKEQEMILGFDGRIYFTDPLKVQYDVRVKDLGRWLRRLAKKHPAHRELLPQVVAWYEDERRLSRGEREWLLSYLLYPSRVMKVLERYILRKRHWAEEGYLRQLRKALAVTEREMEGYAAVAEYFRGQEMEGYAG